MTFDELNEDQRLELKQRILTERNERRGEGTSYGELVDADDLVSDEDLKDWYGATEFSPDDFTCSCHGRTAGSEFEPHPAFGLACGTVDFAAEELRDGESD